MIVIGVVFLVLAALGVGAAVDAGRDVNVHLDSFGVSATVSVLWVFCAGAVAMLLLLIALSAFRRAARKRRQQRRELKQLRAEEAAAAENRPSQRDASIDEPVDRPVDRQVEQPVDVRDDVRGGVRDERSVTGAHAADSGDPGLERRYVPGEERV